MERKRKKEAEAKKDLEARKEELETDLRRSPGIYG